MSTPTVKRERRNSATTNVPQTAEDKEIEEWAKKLASKPPNQIGLPGGQQQTLNSFLNQNVPSDPLIPTNNGFDFDSAIGRFTWHTIAEDRYIPCLFRSGEKYCSIRMVQISIIGDLLYVLPSELYDCTDLTCHQVTPVEARLLTHINGWHCDGFYGSEPFTTNDYVISLKNVIKFYTYLSFAFEILNSGGKNKEADYSKCGFIRVNNDNMIPFTHLPNGEKGVPLFYFEGQTDILKEKATPLTGWELAYLKVCCKVQGVRKDLISGRTLQIVRVSDLKSYFPKRTMFTEDCWPVAKSKSLLPKATYNGLVGTYSSYGQVSIDKWVEKVPYKTDSATNSAEKESNVNSVAPTPSTNSASVVSKNQKNVTPPSNNSNSTSGVVISSSKNGATGHKGNNLAVNFVNGGTSSSPAPAKQIQAKPSDALKKLKVSGPPLDLTKFHQIPETPDASKEGAYNVRLIIIDKTDRQLIHCINPKPFKAEKYLVVLQEFMKKFFPTISIYPTCISILHNCGVAIYLPNDSQVRAFNNFGFDIKHSWEIPLISAIELTQAMTRVKSIFKAREEEIAAAAAASLVTENTLNRSITNGYSTKASNGR